MYLRHTTMRKDGKVHRYWRLVRSVRVGRRVIQQTVAQLGELDERGRIEARTLARQLIGTPEQSQLFKDGSEDLTVPLRLKGIRIERSRQFGDVYLALALWRGTGLEELCRQLLPVGLERIAWAKMAAVLVTARFCEPSSELHIAEDWYRRTALCDLLQLGDEEVNKDRLYRALDHLLAHKATLEAHLSKRCGELFAVQNEVLLYDVTSTYFESAGPAWLFTRPSPGLQAGVHRAGRDLRWLSFGLRGVRREYPRFADLADDRGRHGGPAWCGGTGLDHRPRHGQRQESGVAAPDWPTLHHRRAEVGVEEVRL